MATYLRNPEATLVTQREIDANPYLFKCEVLGCHYSVCIKTFEEGEQQHFTHQCPRRGPNVLAGKSILEQAWNQLDHAVEQIVSMQKNPDLKTSLAEVKSAARGKAEIIALFMVPHFRTADDVSREAMRRYKLKQAGEEVITPGIGMGRMIMPQTARTHAKPVSSPPAEKPKHNLSDQEVKAIKKAAGDGIPMDMLAQMFKVSVAVIRSLAN